MSITQDALRELTPKQLGRYSKAFFIKHYLGLDVPEHQLKWMDYFNYNRHVQLSPRAHGKTTVFLHGFPVWAICYMPDVRILLVSKTRDQAYKSLQVIRRELLSNERIKQDFGDLIENIKQLQSGQIWCKRTAKGQKLKDATVEAVGAEGSITGGHFDIIICDDLVDDENTKTDGRRKNIYNWAFGTIGQLCEPHTQWIFVGTRKHYADIYQDLLENPVWHSTVEKAIIKYPTHFEYIFEETPEGKILKDIKIEGDYEVLWQDMWDIKTLLYDRFQTGSILFDREKQNDPAGMKGQFLNMDWLNYWDNLPPEEELTFYVGVDLAISEREQADETAFALIGFHGRSNKVYIIEIVHGRWDFPTQQKKLVQNFQRWSDNGMRPSLILVEDNVYQAAFVQQISSDTWLPVKGVRTTKDKSTKMMAIAPHFENGKVLLRRATEGLGIDTFIQQWVQFPFGEHDDCLDAVEKAVTQVIETGQSGIEIIKFTGEEEGNNIEEEYVFCSKCGAEYGLGSKVYPKKQGVCDDCGNGIERVKEQ